ncbi:hemolysin III family protein, partial [Promineifilum sp.]|uniref:hemolysin III family protein n=1 Tax=Promineifilum sp. TaxID=2664178 RepID=UPI0035B0DC1A
MEESTASLSFRQRCMQRVNEHYTLGEEIAHSVTHGIGAALSVAALVVLVILAATRGTGWHLFSYTVYGISLLSVYLASTLYHGV